MNSWLKSCEILFYTYVWHLWSNNAIILHMPRQVCCRGMCKIMAWFRWLFFTKSQYIFYEIWIMSSQNVGKMGLWCLAYSSVNIVIIGTGSGLSPARHQATTCTIAELASVCYTLAIHFNGTLFETLFHGFENVVWNVPPLRSRDRGVAHTMSWACIHDQANRTRQKYINTESAARFLWMSSTIALWSEYIYIYI